jgi:C1A family cysteine protease
MTQETHVTPDGRTFILGLPQSPQILRAAVPGVYGATIPASEIPDWEHWPDQLKILDQNGYGACTHYASTQGLMYARLQSGQPHVQLEPLFSYSIATGGWNTGTSILQASKQISEQGVCEAGKITAKLANPRSFSAEARSNAMRFRIEIDQKLESFDELLSEVGGRRRAAIASIQVGWTYSKLDSEGCMGVDRGMGNHAILIAGGKKTLKSGQPALKHAGSWGAAWGRSGFGWYKEAHWDATKWMEAYTIKAVIEDPDDASNPPVVLQV